MPETSIARPRHCHQTQDFDMFLNPCKRIHQSLYSSQRYGSSARAPASAAGSRSTILLFALLLLCGLTAGCGQAEMGGANINVSVHALSQSDVARVTVTVTGANMSAISYDLQQYQGAWQGVISAIPVGSDRTFSAEAYDAADTLLYDGQATEDISSGPPALVHILLQQSVPPDPYDNSVPRIDSLVVSASGVAPEGQVQLEVTASDPDPDDTLAFAWTADDGTFDDASSASPVWTAPASTGTFNLSVVVSDDDASQGLTVAIEVQEYFADGEASIDIELNTWPAVHEIAPSPGRVDINETTALDLTALDNDGDGLTYSWSDEGGECAGIFDDPTAEDPTWTAPAALPASGSCNLTIALNDERGGSTTGQINIVVAPEEEPNLAPEITSTFHSASTVDPGDKVLFIVHARDPEGQSIAFSWSATGGDLDPQADSVDSSQIEWTAPSSGSSFDITVVVTDDIGQQTSNTWTISVSVEGPIAHYTFDDANDLGKDDSGNGHDGSIAGDVSFTASGRIGGAASFDGSGDHIAIPDSPDWVFSGDFSFAAWVSSTSDIQQEILSQGESNSNYTNFMNLSHGGNSELYSRVTSDNTLLYELESTENSYTLNTWMHLTVVKIGNEMRLYKDGDSMALGTCAGVYPDYDSAMVIGGEKLGDTIVNWFHGSVDELRIYDRALSESEITALAEP